MSHNFSIDSTTHNNNNNLLIIPIDKTTMITTTTTITRSLDDTKRREDTLCKFIREYIYKISQIIISARRVYNRDYHIETEWNDINDLYTNNNLNNKYSSWFRIEMSDSLSIREYISTECICGWDPKYNNFELTIDISLSAEPLNSHVLLERWKIKFKHLKESKIELLPSLIYKRMTIQIRSIISYLRLLPTHLIVQSWEQSMAQQSMLVNNNNKKINNKNIYGSDNNNNNNN
eukprot:179225_1